MTKSLAVKAVALKFWTLLGVGVDVPLATRAAYMVVHRNVSAVLAPELTEEEAAEAALDDWVDDTGMVDESTGAEHETSEISFDEYTAGLIGIADMWTSSVDEGEYVRFLQKLYRRITVRAQAPRSRQRVLAPLSSLLGRGEDAWRAEDRDDDEDDDDEQLVVEDDVGEADDELVSRSRPGGAALTVARLLWHREQRLEQTSFTPLKWPIEAAVERRAATAVVGWCWRRLGDAPSADV